VEDDDAPSVGGISSVTPSRNSSFDIRPLRGGQKGASSASTKTKPPSSSTVGTTKKVPMQQQQSVEPATVSPVRRGNAIATMPVTSTSRYAAICDYVHRFEKISVTTFQTLLRQCNIHCDEDAAFELWAKVMEKDPEGAYGQKQRVAEIVVAAGGCVPRDMSSAPPSANSSQQQAGATVTGARYSIVRQLSGVADDDTVPARSRDISATLQPLRASPTRHLSRSPSRHPMRFGIPEPKDRLFSSVGASTTHTEKLRMLARSSPRGRSPSPVKLPEAEISRLADHLHSEAVRRTQRRATLQKEHKAEQDSHVLDDCTFHPRIGHRSRLIATEVVESIGSSTNAHFRKPTEAWFTRSSAVTPKRARSSSPGRGVIRPATPIQDLPSRRLLTSRRSFVESTDNLLEAECTFQPVITKLPLRQPSPNRVPTGFYESICRMRQTPRGRSQSPHRRFEESLRTDPPVTPVPTRQPSTFGYERQNLGITHAFDVKTLAVHCRNTVGAKQVLPGPKLDEAVEHSILAIRHCVTGEGGDGSLEGGGEMSFDDRTKSALDTTATSFVAMPRSIRKILEEKVDSGQLHPADAPVVAEAMRTIQLANLVRNYSSEVLESDRLHRRVVSQQRRLIAPTSAEQHQERMPHYASPLRSKNRPPLVL
jgi:hypothetical protein